MAQLYAACRQGGALAVKVVPLIAALEAAIEPYFTTQEVVFMDGVQDEVDFTGAWNPDPDEVLVLRGLAETQVLLNAVNLNAVALPQIDVAHFQNQHVKALFTAVGPVGNRRLLLQGFQAQQFLTTKFAVLFDNNVFRRVTEPSFSLDRKLVGIVDSQGDVRFKSYHLIRRIFELGMVFRSATDAEINAFAAHPSLNVADAAAFQADADEGIRKSVHALTAANVLGTHNVAVIDNQAQAIGFPLTVTGGRIEVPATRREKKALLGFLLSKVYRGALDPRLFITNSHRPL